MKNTIWVNNYDSYITNEALAALFNGINIDPQTHFDSEVKISLWHLNTTKTGYGHWRIAVELELNDRQLRITTTTTNSIAIDDYHSEEGDENEDGDNRQCIGFESLLSECINDNEEEIIEFILEETENDE